MRNHRSAFLDLPDAMLWLREVWEARETPDRLHTREHEGWGLAYAPAFARRLGARPDDVAPLTTTRTCHHPRLVGNAWDCPDCHGEGTYQTTILAFRYPCWRAMTRLCRENRAAHDVVLTLVINAFDVVGACSVLDCTQDGLLAAIRALHSRYRLAPRDRVAWTDKSEAQQAAESEEGGPIRYAVA